MQSYATLLGGEPDGTSEEEAGASPQIAEQVVMLPYRRIAADPNQPRKEFEPQEIENLRNNIRSNRALGRGIAGSGILHPLTVRFAPGSIEPDGSISKNARYILFDGERRYRASNGNLDYLPCIIRDLSESDAYDYAVQMAMQTQGYSPLEQANMLMALKNHRQLTIRGLAEYLGKSKGWVEHRLNLLGVGEDVQRLVVRRHDSLIVAVQIDKVKNPRDRQALIAAYESGQLTKREVDAKVAILTGKTNPVRNLTERVLPDDPRWDKGDRDSVLAINGVNSFTITGADLGFNDEGNFARVEATPLHLVRGNVATSLQGRPEKPLRAERPLDLGFDPEDTLRVAVSHLDHLCEGLSPYEAARQLPPADLSRRLKAQLDCIEELSVRIRSRLSGIAMHEDDEALATANA